MVTPAEYLQMLFDQFTSSSTKTNSNLAKLFQQASAEDGNNISGIHDNNLIAELNRRIDKDPLYKLPEGFIKVTEKEIENKHVIPDYFPIKESKRIAVETLDGLLFNVFGFHLLEPMSELKEKVRARPLLKAMIKDRVMSELALAPNKSNLLAPGRQVRTTRPNDKLLSHSSDATPLRPVR